MPRASVGIGPVRVGSGCCVALMVPLLIVMMAIFALSSALAAKQYVLKHPKREHCKAHYSKRIEKVKRREHSRIVRVRETVCVYVVPKPTAGVNGPVPAMPTSMAPEPTPMTPPPTPTTPEPTPMTPPPTPTITLRAYLDPSFVQSSSDPLVVTYSYSASATATLTGVSTSEPSLPAGILNLYSDGLLACSINAGGSITGGECPVTYKNTGIKNVVVTYSSGSTSTTATYSEDIEPYPTTTSFSIHEAGNCIDIAAISTALESEQRFRLTIYEKNRFETRDISLGGSDVIQEHLALCPIIQNGNEFDLYADKDYRTYTINLLQQTPISFIFEIEYIDLSNSQSWDSSVYSIPFKYEAY